MKNILILALIASSAAPVYNLVKDNNNIDLKNRGLAAVILAGGIMDERDNIDKKYPRKDCPVCKGKGWYISGDGIARVDCGYCEETKQELFELEIHSENKLSEEQKDETEIDNKPEFSDPPLVPIEKKDSEIIQDPESKKIIIYRR